MAIDMSTVKEIHYNNKEIKKIENSNGDILWQKVVSKAYRELDYIYFSGTEYVGVSAYPIYNYIELSYELTTLVSRGFTLGIYDATSGSQNAKFFTCFDNNNNKITLRVNGTRIQTVNTATYSPVNTFRKLAMTIGSNSYTFQLFDSTDTSVYSKTSNAIPNTWSIDLGVMSCHSIESDLTDHYTNMANGKVYKLITKQTNSTGTILFEGVPCQRKSDSVCGLYDKISNTFFPMQGTYITTTAAGNTVNENPNWSPNA